MAHFAECRIDNNEVIRVIVVSDQDVANNGGNNSTQAEQWVKDNIPQGVRLKAKYEAEIIRRFKTALKTLGRGLATLGTPAGLLATEPLFIAGQIQQGDSLTDIATNPANYLGAAFAGPVTEFATKGLSPTIAKTMRLGISPSVLKTVSRRFGLPGLALSAGISGYELFDDYRNQRGMFSNEE